MTLWLILNSIAITILSAVVYLVLRQLGFILQRSGPVGARATSEGPRVGESIVSYFAPAGWSNGKSKLLVFMSDECSVCKYVRAGTEPLARDWNRVADVYMIYDARSKEDETSLEQLAPGLYVKRDATLRERLGATFVPFSAVTNAEGFVVSKGLVNEIAHLESLLEDEKAKRGIPLVDTTAPASQELSSASH